MDHTVVPMSAPAIVAACAGSMTVCVLLLLPLRAFLASYTGALDPRLVHRPAWVTLPALAAAMVLTAGATTWAGVATTWPRTCASPTVAAALPVLEAATAALLAAAACCDLACRRLPNRLLGPAAALALMHTLAASWWLGTPLLPLWLAVIAGAVLYELSGRYGIGLGDAKLVAVTLTWLAPLGLEQDLRGLVLGLVAAGAYAFSGYRRGRISRDSHIALGPFLVAGALAARLVAAL